MTLRTYEAVLDDLDGKEKPANGNPLIAQAQMHGG